MREGIEAAAPPTGGILGAIGGTPLVRLERYLPASRIAVWAKLEALNPGGSSKARPAARMIAEAIDSGAVRSTTTVVESSSGNMAIGLAHACAYHGLKLICVLDTRTSRTTVRTLEALGADVRVVTRPDPVTGDLLKARFDLVASLLDQTPDSFWPDQYANAANPAAHRDGTMREIDEALNGELDCLVVAAGTAGTLRGCADYAREHVRDVELVAVDSDGSALFDGIPGKRRLPGHGAGVASAHSIGVEFDRLIRVSDLECVVGCRRLVAREAILAGASSGGVAMALERLAPTLPSGARCAMVLPDAGTAYLDTVYDDSWVDRELGCDSRTLAEMVGSDPISAAG